MNEEGFRQWLVKRGLADNSIETRMSAVRRIENILPQLGIAAGDLDAAFTTDSLEGIKLALEDLKKDAQEGGTKFRILLPESEKPLPRLANFRAWLRNYRSFREGPNATESQADKIREYVLETYVIPARESGQASTTVKVGDVNDALSLGQNWRNVFQALSGTKFQKLADVPAPIQQGADDSPATKLTFDLTDVASSAITLFDAGGQAYEPVRQRNQETGVEAYRIKPSTASNRTTDALEETDIVAVVRALLVDRLPVRIAPKEGGAANYLTFGGQKLVRYQLRPDIAAALGIPQSSGSSTMPVPEIPSHREHPKREPENLILYGPPGTGKTYATATEAVRICTGKDVSDRTEITKEYARLVASGRIEFITFHQSYSYEEFVEGLRPVKTDKASIGFELSPEMGVFRRIARRAETSTGSGQEPFAIGDRQVFKMSIGEAANPDDAHLFEDALTGGYTLLGYLDIDWSDSRFATREAIIAACQENQPNSPVPNATSGRVQCPFIFRNWMRRDDIVVVSKGNKLFRAIGVVTGDYQYVRRENGTYSHRRSVDWLWYDRAGVPVEEILAKGFSQRSIYLLDREDLNIPALERYIASQRSSANSAPEPFVLIIDEINRANISKVFGELITLLESDKRMGEENELRVRLPYSREMFGVPSNLHIIGTMNTADRSIALLDTALRRRFRFRELLPEPETLTAAKEATNVNLVKLLSSINERIEYLFDREHQIGHAYFIKCKSRADIDDVMRHRIIPLLAEYFYDDWTKIAAVLGDSTGAGHFIERIALTPPAGADSDNGAEPRYRWSVKNPFSETCYAQFL